LKKIIRSPVGPMAGVPELLQQTKADIKSIDEEVNVLSAY